MLRPPRSPSLRTVPLLLVGLLVLIGADGSARGFDPHAGPRLGLLLDDSSVEQPGALVRVEARWEQIEAVPGTYDWSRLAPRVEAWRERGATLVLALAGSHAAYLPRGGAPSPLIEGSVEAWLGFVRSAVRTFADHPTVFEIAPAPAGESADVLAHLIKRSALAIRAEAGERPVRVAQPAVEGFDLRAQAEIWKRDVAAYVDVLPVRVGSSAGQGTIEQGVQAISRESLLHPPASAIWIYARAGEGWEAAETAVRALGAGASAALFATPRATAGSDQVRWARNLQRALAEGFVPAALGTLSLDRGRLLARFFNEDDFTTMVLYRSPPEAAAETDLTLQLDSSMARNARMFDPLGDRRLRVRLVEAGTGSGKAILVPPAGYPQAALFQKPSVTPGFELPSEELDVESERGLTAEEIIARNQQLQREQDDRLERWMARGRIEFHFKLAQGGGTFNIAIDSNYFWERGGDLEWEQVDYYINGNKVGWKSFPEIPFIQPEKVITLPLDLTLDRTYAYRLVGRDRVGGREAYVIEFLPAGDSSRSLYRGRVWIDTASFARVKTSLLQDNLESPVLSNEEVDLFAEQLGPDGRGYWMFSEIDGQQVWNTAGRTFIVRREVRFDEFRINPPRGEFERRRAEAYASSNQMLRDTDQGFRYLERRDDGSRVVREGMDTSQLFAAAGAFKDNARDNVLPLGGVNYFNFDVGGRNLQLNAFFAGVLGFVTASKPDLFGGRADLTLDAGLSAITSEDKVFEGDDEVVPLTIEDRSQNVAVRLGLPAGPFFKINLIGRLAFRDYSSNDDAEEAIDDLPMGGELEFVLPQDHLELRGELEVEFNRRGYSLIGTASRSSRSDWEPWGLRNTTTGEFGGLDGEMFVPGDVAPLQDDFTRWGITAFKEWYLPRFQRVRGEINYLDGSDLDRFSQYQFSFFGEDRLNGFSGSGVRFDRGTVLRAGYAFNVLEVIQLSAALETARVELEDSAVGSQDFSGIGISANFVAPWKTVVNINYGYALASDIADLEGEQEFLLLVLKLF